MRTPARRLSRSRVTKSTESLKVRQVRGGPHGSARVRAGPRGSTRIRAGLRGSAGVRAGPRGSAQA
eukprot:1739894-Prymnesium_polylepis.1